MANFEDLYGVLELMAAKEVLSDEPEEREEIDQEEFLGELAVVLKNVGNESFLKR